MAAHQHDHQRLVGRSAELERLGDALASPPTVVLVEGEAGIGKSRLVAEALARASRSTRQMIGICQHLAEPPPLGPFVDALRNLGRPPAAFSSAAAVALRPLVPEIWPTIAAADGTEAPEAGLPLDGEAGRASAEAAAAGHIRRRAIRELLATNGTTILVLEDLQWADSWSLDALRDLCARLPENLVLVLTYRRQAVRPASGLLALTARADPRAAVVRIQLDGLDVDAVRWLAVERLVGVDVPESAAAVLRTSTGGNLFALRELLSELCARLCGRAVPGTEPVRLTEAEVAAAGVPSVVRDSELAAVAGLPADARRLMEAVAIWGDPAALADLGAVCGFTESRVLSAARAALASGLLHEDDAGHYRPRMPLAGQALAESIPRAERRVMHRRVAVRMRAAPEVRLASVVRHYREAGMVEEYVSAAELAADRALSACDYGEAARLLLDVASLQELPRRTRARVAVKLAHAVVPTAALVREAVTVLRRCLEDSLPIAVRAQVRHKLGDLLLSAGDISEGRRELARAAFEARPASLLRVHGMVTLANPWGLDGDLDEHMRWLQQALDEASGNDELAANIPVAAMRCELLVCAGDRAAWDAIRDIAWRSTPTEAKVELMWAAAVLIDPCYHLGRYDRARAFLRDTMRRARELGNVGLLAVLDGSEMALDWATGAWSGLRPRVLAFADAHRERAGIATRQRRIAGLLASALGELDAAERDLRGALADAEEAGTVPGIAAAAAGLARLRLLADDAAAACYEAERGVRVVSAKGIWAWAGEIATPAVEALVGCGRTAEARDLTGTLGAGLAGRDAPLARAAFAACRGVLCDADGRTAAAAGHYDRAQRAYAAMPRPYEEAQMSARRGASLLASGDRKGAQHLYEALQTMRTLEASADVARIRRTLRRHSLPVPTEGRRGRVGYGARLTPRQREIADLAARGLTNGEISRRLALASRTVENHLALAMSKLGVRSRTVLARVWDAGGLTPATERVANN